MIPALLTALLLVFAAPAASAIPGPEDATRSFEYPLAADFVVLELQLGVPLTPAADPPYVRVHGDGRVHVHRPSYLRESGDFEAWLTPPDVDALLGHLDANGILNFDLRAAKSERSTAAQSRLQETGSIPGIADAATTHLRIHLERHGPALGGTDFQNQISWYALDHDAEWYPEVEPLQRLHQAVKLLRQLEESAMTAARRGDTTIRLPSLPNP